MDDEFSVSGGRSRSVLVAIALVLGLGAAAYWLVFVAAAPAYDSTELMNRGEAFDAEIISAVNTGDEYEGEAVWELELQVRAGEGRGYRVFHKQPFASRDEPNLEKTGKVRVKVDPVERRKLWVFETGVREFGDEAND